MRKKILNENNENSFFKINQEIFIAFIDEGGIQRQGYFYLLKFNDFGAILKTKQDSVLFVPISKILKIKSKNSGGENGFLH